MAESDQAPMETSPAGTPGALTMEGIKDAMMLAMGALQRQLADMSVDTHRKLAELNGKAEQNAQQLSAVMERERQRTAIPVTTQQPTAQSPLVPTSANIGYTMEPHLQNLFEDNSRPKITHPNPFSNSKKDSINEFVNKCDRIFTFDTRRYGTDAAKIAFASNLLEGEAYQWVECYEDLPPSTRPAFFATWDLFKAELKRKFTTVDIREASRLGLSQLKQGKRDVASYALDFDRLVARLPEYGDVVRRDLFFGGLKEDIRKEMLSPSEFLTYKDLVDRATKYDRQSSQQSKGVPFLNTYSSAVESGATPMEIDGTSNSNGRRQFSKLTPVERQNMMDKGLCFSCKEPGHISRDCPTKKSSNKSIAAVTEHKGSELKAKTGN